MVGCTVDRLVHDEELSGSGPAASHDDPEGKDPRWAGIWRNYQELGLALGGHAAATDDRVAAAILAFPFLDGACQLALNLNRYRLLLCRNGIRC